MYSVHPNNQDIMATAGFGLKKRICWLLLLLPALSCTKTDRVLPDAATAPLVTSLGAPEGTAVTKTIGVNGGAITSADGNISITIPAGALNSDQAITVQPVTRKLWSGYSRVYRLTPHDISFQQPVTITLRYNEDSVKNTLPELLGVAYQEQSGKWFSAGESSLDKINHTLTTTTTHFSDWGVISYLYIQPNEALVQPGAKITLKVMGVIPASAPDIDPVPLGKGDVVNEPFMVSPRQLGNWNYSGEGSLEADGNQAYYQAPASVPRNNPEAVSVAVKTKGKGQFLLVSNITISRQFHIDYLQVDETDMNAGGLDYPSRLWIYGNFGDDPGQNKRSVKVNGGVMPVAVWTPQKIACDIPASGLYSSGMVEVTAEKKSAGKLLNDWVLNMYYDKVESPDGALTRKILFILHFRGDAGGAPGEGQVSMVSETDLHMNSRGLIEMPSGGFTSHVTDDGCGDYTVTWDAIHGLEVPRSKYTDPGGFNGRVVNRPDGFDVKLAFIARNALRSHRRYVDCSGGSTNNDAWEDIEMLGFHNTVIPIRFSNSGSGATIKAGAMPVKTGTGVASGLYFDASDYVPTGFTTRLHWDEAVPKYQ